jgi:hypothetical protein
MEWDEQNTLSPNSPSKVGNYLLEGRIRHEKAELISLLNGI